MVETIILAGGKSSRFKKNKMSTLLHSKPVLLHTIEAFLPISDAITIVTGFYNVEYLSDYYLGDRVKVVHNENHEQGMFSSIQKGIYNTQSDVLIIPGDYPSIKTSTIKQLLDAPGDIRVPVCNGRKGHPIFMSEEIISELRKESIESNLKVFRDRHSVNYVEVTDEGVLLDIDYIEDFNDMKERID